MSRKRDERRQRRISNRKTNGTYTPSAGSMEAFGRLISRAHNEDNGNPAIVRPYKRGYALIGGAGGKGKIVQHVELAGTVGYQGRTDEIVRAICQAALDGGYHIVGTDWIHLINPR